MVFGCPISLAGSLASSKQALDYVVIFVDNSLIARFLHLVKQ